MSLVTSQLIADFAAKGFVILGITTIAAFCLRRKSAAAIHRVWILGFFALLLVPTVGLVLPQRGLKVVPQLASNALPSVIVGGRDAGASGWQLMSMKNEGSPPKAAVQLQRAQNEPAQSANHQDHAAGQSLTVPVDGVQGRALFLSRASMVGIAWALITNLLLVRLILHQVVLARLLHRCSPLVSEEWANSTAEASRHLEIGRYVRLVTHAAATTPAAAGVWRPTILLPADAQRWTASQRQSVLLHELAHVKRCDVLSQLLAGVACAVQWFNPLAWYGLAQMRKLRELACDDLVLAGGQRPTDYAQTLVEVARTYRPRRLAGVVGMARGTNVERRIMAILDTARNRLPLSRRATATLLVISATAILVIGSVRLETRAAVVADNPATSDALQSAKQKKADAKGASATQVPAQTDGGERILEVLITDDDSVPLKGAKVFFAIWKVEGGKNYPSHSVTVDEHGVARIPIPRRLIIVRLWPAKPGYVPEFLNFGEGSHGEGEHIPDHLHFKLARGTKLSGRVVDEAGQPIAGAKVEVSVDVQEPERGENPGTMISTWLTDEDFNSPAPVTNADGRWSIDNAPAQLGAKDYEFRLKITHEEYARDTEWGQFQHKQGITTAMLRAGTATIVLNRGVAVEGTVVNESEKPVTKGLVIWSDHPYWAQGINETQIDDKGHFKTIPLKPGKYPITVAAPGYQPTQQQVEVTKGMKSLVLKLVPGKKFAMKIVDRHGNPIPKVNVRIDHWRGTEAIYNDKHPNVPDSLIPRQPDANGVYTWEWAPEDAVRYSISATSYAEQKVSLVAKSTPHIVTLFDERIAVGKATDARTGQPIAKFSAMPVIVFGPDFYSTRHEDAKVGSEGRYELPLTGSGEPDSRYRVRFEADGYRTLISDESFGPNDGRAMLNISLQPAAARTGKVIDAEGRPVRNAVIVEASPTDVPHANSCDPESYGSRVRTDDHGDFTLNATSEPVLIRALHDSGFAEVRCEPDDPIGTIHLRPWAKVEGRLEQDGRPLGNQSISFLPTPIKPLGEPRFQEFYEVQTDREGKFTFERLPPILGRLNAYLGPWQDSPLKSSESVPLDLQPGERRTIVLPGKGIKLSGMVVPTGRGNVPLDAHWSLNYLVSRERGFPLTAAFPKLGFIPDKGKAIEPAWLSDPHFMDWLATRSHYFVKLSPEGALQINGVPAGTYDLVIQLYEQPAGCLVQTVGQKIVPIDVTATDVSAGEKRLDKIEVSCRVGPRVGEDMRAYKFLDTEGQERTIADMKGHSVLLHVWASWCAPCVKGLTDVQTAVSDLADKPIAFVGLNVDADASAARSLAAAKQWRWAQTYVGENSDVARQLAISSLPAYFLIGPDGRLVASSSEWQEIKKRVDTSFSRSPK